MPDDDNVVHLKSSTTEKETLEVVRLSEDAQGKAFVDFQEGNLRYVEENDQWYEYNGVYWGAVSKLTVIEAARLMNRGTSLELFNKATLQRLLCRRSFAVQVEKFAESDERCLLPMAELDKDPWLLGTPGGIIDLQTGRYIGMGLRPYVTMVTAVEPADVADEHSCPQFLKFMDDFTCGDAELKRFLLQYAGYCLTGDMREQCLILLYGEGDNGKTVFIQLLRHILNDYAINAALDLFVTTSVGKHNTIFADLHRRRLVITNETQEGQTLRMDKIKDITGGEPIRANFMRQNTFEFKPVGKIIMFGNHKPQLPDVGKAVRKRIRLVPCDLRLAEGQMDRGLLDKLKNEGPGILRALIDGCLDWQEHGLIVPERVEQQTDDYFEAEDHVAQWLNECCEIGPNFTVSNARVWKSWATWAEDRKLKVGTQEGLYEKLDWKKFKRGKYAGQRRWEGFKVCEETLFDPDVPDTEQPEK